MSDRIPLSDESPDELDEDFPTTDVADDADFEALDFDSEVTPTYEPDVYDELYAEFEDEDLIDE